jgi:YD repeat-containing protein
LLSKLLTRSDATTSLSEIFGYDTLNRLTSATESLSPTPLVKTFSYNAIGNLTAKSDVGTYTYPAAGQPRPHAVTVISGGTINTTFTYDAKGNMTAGNGLTVAYSSYVTRGTTMIGFSHDPEHQRFQQTARRGSLDVPYALVGGSRPKTPRLCTIARSTLSSVIGIRVANP